MNIFRTVGICLVFFVSVTFSQDESVQREEDTNVSDTIVEESTPKPPKEDSSAVVDSEGDDSEDFSNPFFVDDGAEIEPEETAPPDSSEEEASFVSGSPTADQKEFFDDGDRAGIDVLVDLGLGASLPRFDVKPDYLGTSGTPKFIFNSGILLPFGRFFYGGVHLRFLQLAFTVTHSESIDLGVISRQTYTYDTRETMTFISLPLQAGMRFELSAVTPYVYASVEPAYLTSGHQFAKKTTTTTFNATGEEETITFNSDIDLTDIREQIQLFVGIGVGLELSYGYGAIYIDGALQYSPIQTDKSNDTSSLPLRSSCNVLYTPVTLGIRFFL